ncbi:expressed unknown protein [Seminavis robusta]|uniref:AB hydrolase-1 domain-containing protein n=1 Tax=Seminavis robusta TaxID=568900 RepID=A0A9N8HKA5_9STRA|nr:expressed unknown protein [Seminavis robusta]|eukprot:Sro718_g192140.1 n/a (751) ;mRNA; r:6971-9378
MFGKLFGQLAVPFLLASTVRQEKPFAPSSIQEIRSSMDQMYQDLVDNPGNRTQQISPTLQFSYVSPPINGQSTWRGSSSRHGETTDADNNDSDNNKPIAIYLPGLDGTGITAFTHQFDDLANTFELWRLIIDVTDRSEFRQILEAVVSFIDEQFLQQHPQDNREIVLIGESFGGVLASAVALKFQARQEQPRKMDGLVLVNPATAFEDTNWDTIVPLLASLQYLSNDNNSSTPTPYSLAGGMALSYLIPDNNQLRRIVDILVNAVGIPLNNNNTGNDDEEPMQDAMLGMLEILEERLPAGTLQHRVNQWLVVGTSLVNARLQDLQTPTLVVAGDQDRIMPSVKEVERLTKVMPSCEKLLVRGRGHFVLDENVNLTEAILYSKIDPLQWRTHNDDNDKTTPTSRGEATTRSRSNNNNKKPSYDPIMDWTLPPQKEVDAVFESQVKPLRNIHSPVFLSTDANGKRWRGLAKIPSPANHGPILFVANHQFFGLDLNLIIAELLEERNLICRGMAHPFVFNQTKEFPELRGRTPGLLSSNGPAGGINSFTNFQKFGAVPVTPRNYYKLMQSGQNALLFPGGVKDVWQTDPSYPLLWPEKTDFVRTAARFNATIVPLSAVGMLESARVVVKDLRTVPFLGGRIPEGGGMMPAARFDAPKGEMDPLPPVALPGMPQRNYFVFGKPFSTGNIDPKDKEACSDLYKQVVAETRRGIDDIFHARKKDPFSDTPSRIAYEQITRKQAPTFGLDVVNRERL